MSDLASQTVTCPTCNSDNISIVEYHIHGGECHEVECSDCESVWWEIWQFVGIEMKEGKDNRKQWQKQMGIGEEE